MHILILYQYFGTPKGGWSTRIYEFSRRWVQEGNKITIITAPYEKSDIVSDQFITRKNIEGIQLIIINAQDSNRYPFWKRVWNALTFALVASWYAFSIKADLILASSGPITIGIPALIGKFFARKKMVFEVRDLWPQGAVELNIIKNSINIKLGYWFERLLYNSSNLVVPCSVGMDESIRNKYPKLRTLVMPHGSSDVFFKSSPEIPTNFPAELHDKNIFIYAGSLGLIDDCMQILQGFRLIRDARISLVFIGEGVERLKLESFVISHKIENIYFLGLLQKIEVAKWFSVATASFVTFKDLKVLHTSSPNKLYDSLAAGLPVIHNTKGWIKQLVDKHQCGITVLPNHPISFSEAIQKLAFDREANLRMAENAKKVYQEAFDVDKNALIYLEAMRINCL